MERLLTAEKLTDLLHGAERVCVSCGSLYGDRCNRNVGHATVGTCDVCQAHGRIWNVTAFANLRRAKELLLVIPEELKDDRRTVHELIQATAGHARNRRQRERVRQQIARQLMQRLALMEQEVA